MTSQAKVPTRTGRMRPGRRPGATGTRDALLAAGTELFAERGYDGVPVWEIAKKAGVNKAMISYHFGGKRKLYLTIVGATFSEILERVEGLAASTAPAPDVLRELIAVVSDLASRRHPHFCTMMLREVLAGGVGLEPEVVALPMRILAAVQGQILQAQADIAAAQADAERARAQLVEARANRQDLRIVAPFAGTVATRTAEPGEVVMAGTPVITLVNLAEVYLRAFVPEGQIGQVRVGQPARVYLDSAPTQPIEAFVSRVDPQATFTPENTYFREDRVKQVVGVKLLLRGAVGFAKPGMPADGEILVRGTEWPPRRTRR